MLRVRRGTALAAGILAVAGCAAPEAPAPEAPRGDRAVVVRAGYRAAGSSAEDPASWRHLLLEAPVITPEGLAEHAVDEVVRALRGALPSGPRPRAVRSYEIALRDGDPGLIVIEDPGGRLPLTAIASLRGKEVAASAPALAGFLRRESFDALRDSMTPPRRPLEWSHAALAGFLDSLPFQVDAKPLRAELLSALLANPGPTHLAEALIERASSFPPEELEPLLAEEALAPKLLALTGKASRGDARALEEILTLSLEHFGSGSLFERSLRTLFPRTTNPGLHARHSGSGPARGSFIEAVRAGARAASYDEREGWALER
jgi:hypothetical protein